jgi:hypothetical protein
MKLELRQGGWGGSKTVYWKRVDNKQSNRKQPPLKLEVQIRIVLSTSLVRDLVRTFSLKIRDGGLMSDIAAGQVHRYSPLAAPPARRI